MAKTLTMQDKSQKFGELTLNVGLALMALGLLAWIVLKIRARVSENDDATVSDHDLLTQYRELHQQGGLTDEEFRSIKSQIIARLSARQNPISAIPAEPQTLTNSPSAESIPKGTDVPPGEKLSPAGESPSPEEAEDEMG